MVTRLARSALSRCFGRGVLNRSNRSVVETLEQRIAPATFTVTTAADSGTGSFRQAILDANGNTGLDTIEFNIPGTGVKTIALTSSLPIVTDSLVIDGYTQPGAHANTRAVGNDAVLLIELNGKNAGGTNGLVITAGGSTVRGLVINEFSQDGIVLTATGGNHIEGNFIGTNAAGTIAKGNGSASGQGIDVDTGGNTIGGPTPAERNVISGNGAAGILIVSFSASNNVISGNYIGTNAAGTAALANGNGGVNLGIAPSNIIGGTAAGAGNLIAGNKGGQVSIGGASGNQIQGNFIGTNADGTKGIGGAGDGVLIYGGASGNLVGGFVSGARNIISGMGDFAGVNIQDTGSTGNLVQGNYIGTDVNGVASIPNGPGVLLQAPANTIGGTSAGAGNLISGNRFEGIFILSLSGSDASGNMLQGNFIGTDAAGTAALGNGGYGIAISGTNTDANIIGGPATGAGNLISGNDGGVSITGTNGTVIKGNQIGVNVTGNAALANTGAGIVLKDSADVVIGGSGVGDRNIISGNAASGVDIQNSVRTVILGNTIGRNGNGTVAIPNLGNGIQLSNASSASVIGGINADEGNLISGNRGEGIRLAANTFANAIRGNSIYGNGGLAIDLLTVRGKGGVTLNDLGDADIGANGLQNFPQITSITDGSSTTIRGMLSSTPNATFSVDLYSSVVPDRGGFGGGQFFLGTVAVSTDATGVGDFNFTPGENVPTNYYVTATATNAANETSEYSGQYGVLSGAANVTVLAKGKTVTLVESDGDKLTIKTSKGTLTPGLFSFTADGKLQIDLGGDSHFNNANLTITAKSVRGLGDQLANLDMFEAQNLNLGKLAIRGEVGHINAGSGDFARPAVKSLSVASLGPDPELSPYALSNFQGSLPNLTVKKDVQNAAVQVLGRLGKVTIGGSVYGDVNAGAGLLSTLETFGSFARGVAGGIPVGGFSAGGIGTFTVKHDMNGGSVQSASDVGAVQVRGDVKAGGFAAEGQIRVAKFLRNVGSDDPGTPFVFAALAKVGSTKLGGAVAIDSLAVGGNVENAQILLGYGKQPANQRVVATAKNPDASAGKIVVNGNWIATSLVAGVVDATGDGFGRNDTLIPGDTTPQIEARIAKIIIKGTATGSAADGDFYAITAQQIGSLTINGIKIPLTKDVKDDILLDETNNDFRVVEL